MDLQHPFSSESCRSSTVDHDEEVTLESSRVEAGCARGDEGDCREGDERRRRRCMEAGTRKGNGDVRDQSRYGRGGKAFAWTLMVKATRNEGKLKNYRSQSDVPGGKEKPEEK